MAIATRTEPRAMGRLRKKVEGKLIALCRGGSSKPEGIFTCLETAVWSIRHYGPFNPATSWWLYLYDRDRLDPEASRHPILVPDEVTEFVCMKKLAP